MTINAEALISSLGKSYKEMIEAGLIPYRSGPRGSSGSPTLHLDMAKEGAFLSFHRRGRVFKEITLSIQRDEIKNWGFPNELPLSLQRSMSREWAHEAFGQPDKSIPPQIVGITEFGWFDRFTVEGFGIPVTMVIRYDTKDMVADVTFIPTSELRW